jgi:formate hydrogenlyase subunit 3/multisubunit Na+/H+ antiporter MnhD subunit
MCAFTTKTAVYALCRGFAGMEILVVPLGVIMALYGVVYAVLENDCRRLLAYHIISQVGYMVAGVGPRHRASPSTAPAPTPSPTFFTRACSSWAAAPCCT